MYIGLWIAVTVISLIAEVATAQALVAIWFVPGALAALVLALLDLPFLGQCLLFLFVSLLALFILKPQADRYLKGNTIATNSDRIIGQVTELTKAITFPDYGEIILNGVTWNAIALGKENIRANTPVKVITIDGNKAVVKKI